MNEIKIAFPRNFISEQITPFFEEVKDKYKLQAFILNDSECESALYTNKVDLALISPLAYAKSTGNADLRIVPTNCITSRGATRILSLSFKEGLKTIKNLCVPNENDFLMIAGKILLAERYNVITELKRSSKTNEIPSDCDARIDYNESGDLNSSIDLSEDWLETFNHSLPIYNWVSRYVEDFQYYYEITSALAPEDIKDKIITEFDPQTMLSEDKIGKIKYKWDEEQLSAMENVIQLLYYHGFIENIGDVRILENE